MSEVHTEAAPDDGLSEGGSRAFTYLVLAFLAEGVVAEFSFRHAPLLPHALHMLFTALASVGLLALAASRRALGGRALAVNASVKPVRLCVLALVLWGFLSSVAQVRFVAGNFAFWAVWAASLGALWWAAPRLLQWQNVEERLRPIGLVLAATLAVTALTAPLEGLVQGRFGGPFANPTIMGRISVLALLFYLAQLVARGGWDARSAFMALAACVPLGLSRTRACVAAAAVGVAVCLIVAALSARGRARARTTRVAAAGLFCSALLGVSLLMAMDTAKVAGFLRVGQGFGQIYSTAREMNWQAGVERLRRVGFFGEGFLSKFDPAHVHTVMGITVPGYDWTTDRDPLNSVLGTCQQTGWVGGALFACMLALLVWRSLKAQPRVRPLLAGLCAAGLVWGLFDGNWLTSFGDPVDRLSFIIFALLLSAPQGDPDPDPGRTTQ